MDEDFLSIDRINWGSLGNPFPNHQSFRCWTSLENLLSAEEQLISSLSEIKIIIVHPLTNTEDNDLLSVRIGC